MLPLVLFLAFLLLPVLEIYVILQVGQLIGGWETAVLLLAESLLGAWIVRREGRRAWRALRETFGRGALPDRELSEAALVLVGGVLLLTPGFVTDVLGFVFVLPFTRPAVRRALAAYVRRRVRTTERSMGGIFPPGPGGGAAASGSREASAPGSGNRRTGSPGPGDGPVIQGQVLDEDPS
ncbi:MAG TPA: FxsA family protein [Actinomadura sp.]|jgi:UPF0716 protein FxsA|nr:FxsA family protein [Actinomadura sp.]